MYAFACNILLNYAFASSSRISIDLSLIQLCMHLPVIYSLTMHLPVICLWHANVAFEWRKRVDDLGNNGFAKSPRYVCRVSRSTKNEGGRKKIKSIVHIYKCARWLARSGSLFVV